MTKIFKISSSSYWNRNLSSIQEVKACFENAISDLVNKAEDQEGTTNLDWSTLNLSLETEEISDPTWLDPGGVETITTLHLSIMGVKNGENDG